MTAKSPTRTAAIEAGELRYFTGKPCKFGHIAERHVSSRGCMECAKVKVAEFRARHPDRVKASYDKWYAENRERWLEHRAEYREANRDRIRAAGREYWNERPEYRASQAAKRKLSHPNYYREYLAKIKASNPERLRAKYSYHRSRRLALPGQYTDDDLRRIYKQQKGRCAYCRKPLKGRYEVDHIVAVDRGGTNHASNIQLTCRPCNRSKGASDPLVFARRIGRLL